MTDATTFFLTTERGFVVFSALTLFRGNISNSPTGEVGKTPDRLKRSDDSENAR